MKKILTNLTFILFVNSVFLIGISCEAEIGDSCSSSTDCSSKGDRICDVSSPGGYCTISGCQADSCPSESVCISFYPPELLVQPCNPITEDAWGENTSNDCNESEVCLSSGYCAPTIFEHRYCMKKCSKDSDCRSNYKCIETSTAPYAQKTPNDSQNTATTGFAKFCSPTP